MSIPVRKLRFRGQSDLVPEEMEIRLMGFQKVDVAIAGSRFDRLCAFEFRVHLAHAPGENGFLPFLYWLCAPLVGGAARRWSARGGRRRGSGRGSGGSRRWRCAGRRGVLDLK